MGTSPTSAPPSGDGLAATGQRRRPGVALPWAAKSGPAHGPVAARPILRPLPAIPSADRATLRPEARMRLAVALDVMCSATRRIAPGPTILVQVVRAWLSLRGRSSDPEAYAELLAQAHSPQGSARSRISAALTAAAHADGPGPEGRLDVGRPLSGPTAVAMAARRIEAAGACIVAEAALWLTSREHVDYRRG